MLESRTTRVPYTVLIRFTDEMAHEARRRYEAGEPVRSINEALGQQASYAIYGWKMRGCKTGCRRFRGWPPAQRSAEVRRAVAESIKARAQAAIEACTKLTADKRALIPELKAMGWADAAIAVELGVGRSTVTEAKLRRRNWING